MRKWQSSEKIGYKTGIGSNHNVELGSLRKTLLCFLSFVVPRFYINTQIMHLICDAKKLRQEKQRGSVGE